MSSYIAPPAAVSAAGDIDHALAGLIANSDLEVFAPYEVDELLRSCATMQNRLEAWVASQLLRLARTQEHRLAGRSDVTNRCARVLGITPSEAVRIIHTAERLEGLREVAAAAANGCLSGRETEMIVGVAADYPDMQRRLLAAAGRGIQPLKDECSRVRRENEPDGELTQRLHRQRSFRSWFDDDGMYNGRFRLTAEVGAEVKAAIQDMQNHLYRHRNRDADDSIDNRAADALTALILANCPPRPAAQPHDAPAPQADSTAGVGSTPVEGVIVEVDIPTDSCGGGDPSGFEHGRESADACGDQFDDARSDRFSEPTANVDSRAQRLRDLGLTRSGKGRTVNVIVDIGSLRRGQLEDGGRCEIPGVGYVSVGWVQSILPRSTLRLVIVEGDTVRTVCHVGPQVPGQLLHALAPALMLPNPPSPAGVCRDSEARYVVIVVLDRELLSSGADSGSSVAIAGIGPIDSDRAVNVLSRSGVDILARKGRALDDIVTETRHIPAELVTALLVAGRECEEPDCHNRGYLEIDHTIEFSRGGLTCWHNNKYRCAIHHREKTAIFNRRLEGGPHYRQRPPPSGRRRE